MILDSIENENNIYCLISEWNTILEQQVHTIITKYKGRDATSGSVYFDDEYIDAWNKILKDNKRPYIHTQTCLL